MKKTFMSKIQFCFQIDETNEKQTVTYRVQKQESDIKVRSQVYPDLSKLKRELEKAHRERDQANLNRNY